MYEEVITETIFNHDRIYVSEYKSNYIKSLILTICNINYIIDFLLSVNINTLTNANYKHYGDTYIFNNTPVSDTFKIKNIKYLNFIYQYKDQQISVCFGDNTNLAKYAEAYRKTGKILDRNNFKLYLNMVKACE